MLFLRMATKAVLVLSIRRSPNNESNLVKEIQKSTNALRKNAHDKMQELQRRNGKVSQNREHHFDVKID